MPAKQFSIFSLHSIEIYKMFVNLLGKEVSLYHNYPYILIQLGVRNIYTYLSTSIFMGNMIQQEKEKWRRKMRKWEKKNKIIHFLSVFPYFPYFNVILLAINFHHIFNFPLSLLTLISYICIFLLMLFYAVYYCCCCCNSNNYLQFFSMLYSCVFMPFLGLIIF